MKRIWLFFAVGVVAVVPVAFGQEEDSAMAPAVAPAATHTESQRILGLIPNYQTVSDPHSQVKPLTVREKYGLFLKSTADPFVMADVAMGTALSHASRGVPDYGSDRGALGARLGAAYADMMTQNALTGAVLPALFRQDPRYFRLGPQAGILRRIGYSMSRVAVIRTDEGKQVPNWSFLVGTVGAVALSNSWYPPGDRTGAVMGTRVMAITMGSATGNLLPEFWPDIHDRIMPHIVPYLLLHFRKGARGAGMSAPAVVTGY